MSRNINTVYNQCILMRLALEYSSSVACVASESHFIESANATGWREAKKQCETYGDTLLYLKTIEEVYKFESWLQGKGNFGSLYWVGGRNDTGKGQFIWDNGVQFSKVSPWDVGQPRDKNTNSRVYVIGGLLSLGTKANTASLRYICESEATE